MTRGFNWRYLPEWAWLTGIVLVFLYAPLVILIIYAFNAADLATEWGGVSLKWFAKALQNDDLQRATANSIIVALSATVLATLLAIPASLALERAHRMPARGVSESFVALPLVAPEIVTAITTLIFFRAIGLSLGLGNLIVAHTTFCIPFAMLPIRSRLRDMPAVYEEAARDLYSDPWTTFRLVTLPLLMPGIMAGAALAFVVSLDDFLITLMVAEAGSTTLPVYLYGMLRLGVTPEANAAATLLLALSVGVILLFFVVTERARRSTQPQQGEGK
jgi:spermidine/putrescine transport system permease protein